jgi:hypothetical protein
MPVVPKQLTVSADALGTTARSGRLDSEWEEGE